MIPQRRFNLCASRMTTHEQFLAPFPPAGPYTWSVLESHSRASARVVPRANRTLRPAGQPLAAAPGYEIAAAASRIALAVAISSPTSTCTTTPFRVARTLQPDFNATGKLSTCSWTPFNLRTPLDTQLKLAAARSISVFDRSADAALRRVQIGSSLLSSVGAISRPRSLHRWWKRSDRLRGISSNKITSVSAG